MKNSGRLDEGLLNPVAKTSYTLERWKSHASKKKHQPNGPRSRWCFSCGLKLKVRLHSIELLHQVLKCASGHVHCLGIVLPIWEGIFNLDHFIIASGRRSDNIFGTSLAFQSLVRLTQLFQLCLQAVHGSRRRTTIWKERKALVLCNALFVWLLILGLCWSINQATENMGFASAEGHRLVGFSAITGWVTKVLSGRFSSFSQLHAFSCRFHQRSRLIIDGFNWIIKNAIHLDTGSILHRRDHLVIHRSIHLLIADIDLDRRGGRWRWCRIQAIIVGMWILTVWEARLQTTACHVYSLDSFSMGFPGQFNRRKTSN